LALKDADFRQAFARFRELLEPLRGLAAAALRDGFFFVALACKRIAVFRDRADRPFGRLVFARLGFPSAFLTIFFGSRNRWSPRRRRLSGEGADQPADDGTCRTGHAAQRRTSYCTGRFLWNWWDLNVLSRRRAFVLSCVRIVSHNIVSFRSYIQNRIARHSRRSRAACGSSSSLISKAPVQIKRF
jgi:hypothetical protein